VSNCQLTVDRGKQLIVTHCWTKRSLLRSIQILGIL